MEQEIFWRTIALYNATTGPIQILLIGIGTLLTILLYRYPAKGVKVAMKLFMAFLNAWIAIAYYLISCKEREYNEILALIWGIMALMWLFDLGLHITPFERSRRYRHISWLLYLLPFLYPVASLARGLNYPELTTPVMPCSVAIFTLALLSSFPVRANLFIILLIIHWAFIGLSKASFYQMPEDYILVGTILPAFYLFFREYHEQLKKERF